MTLTDKVMSEILARWDMLVGKLTELSPKMYEAYFRQAYVVGGIMTTIISGIVVLVALLIAANCFSIALKEDEEYFGPAICFGVVGLAAFGLFLCPGIAHLLNPHYYTIRSITETVMGR
jgi:hypothetical protein